MYFKSYAASLRLGGVHMWSQPLGGWAKKFDIKFEAILDHIESLKPAWTIEWNPISNQANKQPTDWVPNYPVLLQLQIKKMSILGWL